MAKRGAGGVQRKKGGVYDQAGGVGDLVQERGT